MKSNKMSGAALYILLALTAVSFNVNAASYLVGGTADDIASIQERLRRRIETVQGSTDFSVHGELVFASVMLPLFYERRAFEPAWVDEHGPLTAVDMLLKTISRADREGLRPEDYHLEELTALYKKQKEKTSAWSKTDVGALVDLELLCTDAFLIYGSHLLSGRVNPQTIDAEWFANRRDADLASVLETALKREAVDSVLSSLLPPQSGYRLLRVALERYRKLQAQGGWEKIPGGPTLESGEEDSRVSLLRKRLFASGDLDRAGGDSVVFDPDLEQAVMRFQQRHGLDVDGKVGPATLATLNVPLSERISQLLINLERWRWLPQELGYRHVLVNIASFELEVVENASTVLSMRVIVGKPYRRTPVFSDRITYLVINPFWNVPTPLAVKDVLPKVKAQPDYLEQNDFEVLSGWGEDMQMVKPDTVNWASLGPGKFPYRLRQKPGSKNALGKIKFMFPNQFNVYLHDTPERGLFARATRNFSSGCIRIERPLDFARYLLHDQSRWADSALEQQIEKGIEQTVRLSEPVAIHILYWTAWADRDGTVNFRNDVYERDRALFEALREEPPGSN